jgi:Protein of unknown function (DUF2778)
VWVYEIVSGRWSRAGALLAVGYSGAPGFVNDPTKISVPNQGPIPVGLYTISPPRNTLDHGPEAMPLAPDLANQMFGRFGFWCHGDNEHDPGTASEGCVILPRFARDRIAEGLVTNNRVQVIAQLAISF